MNNRAAKLLTCPYIILINASSNLKFQYRVACSLKHVVSAAQGQVSRSEAELKTSAAWALARNAASMISRLVLPILVSRPPSVLSQMMSCSVAMLNFAALSLVAVC